MFVVTALVLDVYPNTISNLIMCLQNSVQERICLAKDQILDLYMYRNEAELFDCCDYIETSDCNNFITKLSDLSILQLNIHGLLG